MLDLLKENFGGSIYTYKPSNPNHRAWSVWQTYDKQARDILGVLRPYFMAKKRQAELVVDFVNVCEAQWQQIKCTQKAPYHITADMLALREHYWEQVSALNTTGKDARVNTEYQGGPLAPAGKIFLSALAFAPALTLCLQEAMECLI